jgi:hypothetical protein
MLVLSDSEVQIVKFYTGAPSLPEIVIVPREEMIKWPVNYSVGRFILLGQFRPSENKVYLREDWRERAGLGIVIHEVAHFMQHSYGIEPSECTAYSMQLKYNNDNSYFNYSKSISKIMSALGC